MSDSENIFDIKKRVGELRAYAMNQIGELADILNGAADTIELMRVPVLTIINDYEPHIRTMISDCVTLSSMSVIEQVPLTEENKIILKYSPIINEKISIYSANNELGIDKKYDVKDFVIRDNVITVGGPALDDKCELFLVSYSRKTFNIIYDDTNNNLAIGNALKYIDNCDEDQWQEFCGCLECRGWYLNSLKWVPVSIQMPLPRTDVWVSSDLGQMSAWYDDRWNVWRASHNHDLELIVRAWHDLPDDYEEENE